MVHDTHASDTAPEPDSPSDDDISYSDWQSLAGAMIEVSIDKKIWPYALVNSFQHTAPKIFDDIIAAHDSPPASVSLCLCDDLQMRQINRQHRQIDKATNILNGKKQDFENLEEDKRKFDKILTRIREDVTLSTPTPDSTV